MVLLEWSQICHGITSVESFVAPLVTFVTSVVQTVTFVTSVVQRHICAITEVDSHMSHGLMSHIM